MDEPLDIKGFHITGHPDDDVNGVYTKRDYGGLSNEQRKMVNKGLYNDSSNPFTRSESGGVPG